MPIDAVPEPRRLALLATGFHDPLDRTPPPEIREVVSPGFQPELVHGPLGFPATPYDRELTAVGVLALAVRAQAEGFAGVFINTFGDYGIDAARSALHIPVVGAGEAAMAFATTLGRRFAIVTIWPRSLDFIYRERLLACELQSRCVGVEYVMDEPELAGLLDGLPDGTVQRMRSGAEDVLARIVSGAERAVEAGADVIVLGCTCMAGIAPEIARRLAVPVVEPSRTGYLHLESMLRLGTVQSRSTWPQPAAERLATAQRLSEALARELPAAAPADCPVCVVAEPEGPAAERLTAPGGT
jgi:allantoin racemase